MAQPTVLVLNGELGFMFAISQELSKRHIAAFPARTVREARLMITRFQIDPDLFVIDCRIPGACSFTDAIAAERKDVPIIGIVSESHECGKCSERLAARFRDPEDQGPERIPYCADVILDLLREQRRRAHRASGT